MHNLNNTHYVKKSKNNQRKLPCKQHQKAEADLFHLFSCDLL